MFRIELGLQTLDFEIWTLDFALWTLDFGLWTLDIGVGGWTWDFRVGIRVYGAERELGVGSRE